jgi:hypothetical protein
MVGAAYGVEQFEEAGERQQHADTEHRVFRITERRDECEESDDGHDRGKRRERGRSASGGIQEVPETRGHAGVILA